MKTPKILRLSHNSIHGTGFENYHNATELHWLDLSGCPITNEGLRAIVQIPRLLHLSLNHTPVDNSAIELMQKIKSLKGLGLNGTKITKEGVAKLRELLPECRIEAD